MNLKLFSYLGGEIVLPDKTLILASREDGGNLIVNPPREVWERSELTPSELMHWSFLVAATGRAMLDVLPQLEGGCINYWEAGNWSLNEQAEPQGFKTAVEYRKVHLHVFGRNPGATNPYWKWGEAPKFPDFIDRHKWASANERLTPEECQAIILRVEILLQTRYEIDKSKFFCRSCCERCGYRTDTESTPKQVLCLECQVI